MIIKSVAIHEITKEVNKTSAEVFCSTELLDVNDSNIQRIINSLDESFTKKTLRRAKFSDSGFKEEIKDFGKFVMLKDSEALTTKLKNNIQGISSAKGGYLIFAEVESKHKFLAIFMVRNSDGTKLKQSGSSWDLDSTQYLDTEHFAMGVKINLTLLNGTSEERYISLARGNTDISQYFESWVGVDDSKEENIDADALYGVANKIDLPPEITSRDEFKKAIFDYAKAQPSRTVNLRELSQFLYSDAEKMPKYCQDNDIDIDGEFKLTGRNLSKFFKVSVKADGIELAAPRSSFNPNMISYQGDKVMIHSSSLVQAIKASIENN